MQSLPHVSQSPHDPHLVQDPYAFYARMHRQGSVFYWEEYDLVAFAGFDAVGRLLRDRRFGRQILHVATRKELGWPERPAHLRDFDRVEKYSLLELEPPAHTKLRRLITSAFISRQVETLRGAIRQTCHAQIDRLEPLGRGDLLTSYAMRVPLITICNLLGIAPSNGQKLLDWSHAIVRMYVLDPSLEAQIAANSAARDFALFLEEEIARKRSAPGDDLLSALIGVDVDGDRLTIDELISTTVVLLNAGHEASVHQFGNMVRNLLTADLDIPSLLATPESCAATVEEALRHDAPLHMFTRHALEDLSINIEGHALNFQKGEKIALLLGAANRDPRAFADPDAFHPERTDQKNVSFGAGIHFCIGAPLARIELQEMLAVLFERLPQCKLASAPRYADVYHFHGLEKLDLSWSF